MQIHTVPITAVECQLRAVGILVMQLFIPSICCFLCMER